MGKISKSIVRTGVTYKERTEENRKCERMETNAKRKYKKNRKRRERKKERNTNWKCHRSLPKRRSIKITEARAKEIVKEY